MGTPNERAATERVHRAKADLLRQAGHRARNSLNGVVGLAELVGTAGVSAEPTLIASLVSSGRDLKGVLLPLLDVACADPDLPDEPSSFALAPLLRELADFHQLLARGRLIGVTCELPKEPTAKLRTDRLKFTLLLHLLTARAVAACDEGGSVTIGMHPDGHRCRLRIGATPRAQRGDPAPRQAAGPEPDWLAELGTAVGVRLSASDAAGATCVALDVLPP
jgi:signal transduction histidine kinase